MKQLHFCYQMELLFDSPVWDHYYTLKGIPISDKRQRLVELNVDIHPSDTMWQDVDGQGVQIISGHQLEAHERFEVKIEGKIETGLSYYIPSAPSHQIGIYRQETEYTSPGTGIRAMYEQMKHQMGEALDPYLKALEMMGFLYENFRYEPGTTNVYTKAEEAMNIGSGVCQDYAHIFIALCHLADIPARYVVGMLIGEGKSHAWVEIYHDGRWYALDPTNNIIVTDRHIKISHGRDYRDCQINRGIFHGESKHTQTIHVSVEEI